MAQISTVPHRTTQAAPIRALGSLACRDTQRLDAALDSLGASLAVELHDDYDGYLSILLTPPEDDSLALLISGRMGAIEFALVQGERLHTLGTFATMEALFEALPAAISRLAQAR